MVISELILSEFNECISHVKFAQFSSTFIDGFKLVCPLLSNQINIGKKTEDTDKKDENIGLARRLFEGTTNIS